MNFKNYPDLFNKEIKLDKIEKKVFKEDNILNFEDI